MFLYTHMNSSGRWEDDKRNGKGTYQYVNGDVYDGDWKDNKKHGKGIYTCTTTKLKVCHPLTVKNLQ